MEFLPFSHDPAVRGEVLTLFRTTARALLRHGIGEGERVYPIWVPARIEVLGKHTDYAGGNSLVAALSKGFAFLAHANDSTRIFVIDASSRQEIQINLSDNRYSSSYSWKLYVQTVLERVQSNFGSFQHGASIAMSSNIPTAAGMSSSSALMIGFFLALKKVYLFSEHSNYKNNIHTALELADYLGHVENGQTYKGLVGEVGVGTFGGSQDHAAILCSKAGFLRLFSFQPSRFLDEVALPEEYCFVIGCSGVKAEKTRSARVLYNRCALLVQDILACNDLNPEGRHKSLGELVQEQGFLFSSASKILRAKSGRVELEERLFQFVQESYEIIPKVVSALRSHDLGSIGDLVDTSQELARTYLKNQIPETNYLVYSARSLGALASSAFGAGFGGSVWALVAKTTASKFMQDWESTYLKKYAEWQKSACFFVDTTSDGASVL